MKLFLTIMSLVFVLANSTNAFAIPDDELARLCFAKAKLKFVAAAIEHGCEENINTDNISVRFVDNRSYVPLKYVAYEGWTSCGGSGMFYTKKLVPYIAGRCL
jgi:hypothetical protein